MLLYSLARDAFQSNRVRKIHEISRVSQEKEIKKRESLFIDTDPRKKRASRELSRSVFVRKSL